MGSPSSRSGRSTASPSAARGWTAATAANGFPCDSTGNASTGGTVPTNAMGATSSGACAIQASQAPKTSDVRSAGYSTNATATSGPTGCAANSNDVTMPKFPPPPRRPQCRSGCSSALAVRMSPSAVTTCADSRLSQLSPCFRRCQPMPPERVSPATPVSETIPTGTASPWACVAASRSPSVAPPAARAVPRAGSTSTSRIRDRSITRPSSTVPVPATLWPPPRTATIRPCSRASRSATTTSLTPAHRATMAGRRSITPFQTERASS